MNLFAWAVIAYPMACLVVYGASSEFEDDPAAAFLYAVLWPITLLIFIGVKIGRLLK